MNFVGLSRLVHFSFYSPQILGGINTLVKIWYLNNEAMAVPVSLIFLILSLIKMMDDINGSLCSRWVETPHHSPKFSCGEQGFFFILFLAVGHLIQTKFP